MTEPDPHIPVHVEARVQSPTHVSFELDCSPLFSVDREGKEWYLRADFVVREAEALLATWRTVDAYLAAMSIVNEGVFTRVVWSPRDAFGGITFPADPPRELWAVGGLTVTPTRGVDQSRAAEVVDLAQRVSSRVEQDDGAFAAITMYSAASWFLTANLMRESALNFFAAVEIVASELNPGVRKNAVYQWGDIRRALKPLALSADDINLLHDGYRQRGESAHGKASQLILAQHSLGVYPATSYSLKLPALACKAAADVVLQSYLR